MGDQIFRFRKAVEYGEQTLRELRGRDLDDEEIGLVRLFLKYKGIAFRYEAWELGFAYYMKYTLDAHQGPDQLHFVLEDETDVPDWQRRVRIILEGLESMSMELKSSGAHEFHAWIDSTLNKLQRTNR